MKGRQGIHFRLDAPSTHCQPLPHRQKASVILPAQPCPQGLAVPTRDTLPRRTDSDACFGVRLSLLSWRVDAAQEAQKQGLPMGTGLSSEGTGRGQGGSFASSALNKGAAGASTALTPASSHPSNRQARYMPQLPCVCEGDWAYGSA